MSTLQKIVSAVLVLQLSISGGGNVLAAPESCLVIGQNEPGQVVASKAKLEDRSGPVLGFNVDGFLQPVLNGVLAGAGAFLNGLQGTSAPGVSGYVRITPTKPESKEHERIDLKCEASKSLAPNFKWYKNGKAIEIPAKQNTLDSITESVVTIETTKEDNGAVFYCSVWSESLKKVLDTCYVTLDVKHSLESTSNAIRYTFAGIINLFVVSITTMVLSSFI